VTTEREKLNLDDLVRQLMGSIPDSLRAVGDDLENNFRGLLKSGLERMDLVTREEFDLQVAVLERTRTRLEALEVELKRLEDRLGSRPH
jgi:BMFP domain-containing protein YqiC